MASSSRQAAADIEAAMKGLALVKAAGAGDFNEVTRLLGKKADINYVHRFMFEGKEYARTPLMAAVREGHAEVAKFLITRKANVNLAEPCHGRTALHDAADRGSIPMIELLISKGVKHDVRDSLGYTPLHYAARDNGHKEAVAYLLDHGADMNAASNDGITALQTAAAIGHLEIVKLLVLKGAGMKMEGRGLTALDGAALEGHEKVVDFLIKSGARFNETGTVAKDCKFCGKVDPVNMLRCIGCKSIHYCCAECQKSDWKNHNPQCLSIKAMREKYMEEGIKVEIEEKFQKFKIEKQAKDEGAGPSTSAQALNMHRSHDQG